MAKEIIMPKFGFTQETADIVKWLKQEGDQVDAGDPIAEVTTDKVNMEVEATASGILAGLKYKEGDTVPVTEIIAYIIQPGEAIPDAAAPQTKAPAAPAAPSEPAPEAPSEIRPGQVRATPVATQYARDKGVDMNRVTGSGPRGRVTRADVDAYIQSAAEGGKVRATPGARRLAGELGVALEQVSGSGPRGRVQGSDVRQYAETQVQAEPAAQAVSVPLPAGEEKVIPYSNIRRIIAERMQKSAQEAPHIYLNADINMAALEALRKRANAKLGEGQPNVSLTILLLRGVAWALQRHPLLNSRLESDGLHLLPGIHIGVAVAADQGLIVPVLRDVPLKSVPQLALEMSELVARARENRLRPDDVSGGTFTISNLGMFGVDNFTAIINPPQTAILSVGAIHKVFLPDENDQPVLQSVMTITVGADHRAVDGVIAARFLADLREVLEHPEIIVL